MAHLLSALVPIRESVRHLVFSLVCTSPAQTHISAAWDEQVPAGPGDHLQEGQRELQTKDQQEALSEGTVTEGGLLLSLLLAGL